LAPAGIAVEGKDDGIRLNLFIISGGKIDDNSPILGQDPAVKRGQYLYRASFWQYRFLTHVDQKPSITAV